MTTSPVPASWKIRVILRALDLIGVRCEHGVDSGDLFGMDRPLAGEPEVACLPRGRLHAVGVLEIQVRHVDDVEPGRCRRVHDPRPSIEQRSFWGQYTYAT